MALFFFLGLFIDPSKWDVRFASHARPIVSDIGAAGVDCFVLCRDGNGILSGSHLEGRRREKVGRLDDDHQTRTKG